MLFFPVEWGGGVFRKVFFLVGGFFWMVMFLGGVFLGGGVFGWWLCFARERFCRGREVVVLFYARFSPFPPILLSCYLPVG